MSSSALPSLPAPGMEMVPMSDPSAGLMTRTRYLLLLGQRHRCWMGKTYRAVESPSLGREDRLTFAAIYKSEYFVVNVEKTYR